MSLSDCDRASRRIPVGGRGGVGKGASMSPAVVWNHDDPHPALLLASRSLAAGASACTPCGAGSYYGSTGVRAFVCAGSCVHVSRVFISPIRKKNSAGRGLASPKACVGVWLLVLIVFLLLLQVVLGHIACFWLGVGVGGVRAAEEWVLCGSGGA